MAWLNPPTHVHAPVPVMPWSQIPPTPHAHGRQAEPYWSSGHCPHEVPLGKVPVGQVLTHESVAGSSTRLLLHAVHVPADPAHARQLALQGRHAPPAEGNMPTGHDATQVLPSKCAAVAETGSQLVQVLSVPATHVWQLAAQGKHCVPSENVPGGHDAPQAVPAGCTRSEPLHCVHVSASLQTLQPARQLWQVPLMR